MTDRTDRFSNASLGITTGTASSPPDEGRMIEVCQQLGLCSDRIDDHRYLVGERFLDHINFLGCSPNICFDDDGGAFTHIIFHRPVAARLFEGRFTRPPHCHHCGSSNSDWRDRIDDAGLICPHCDTANSNAQLDWRRTAAYTDCLIEVTEIFPKEAVPQPSFMQQLGALTELEWKHFYY